MRSPLSAPPATTRLRKTVYLPEADIRRIISPDSDDERAALLRALIGAPNVVGKLLPICYSFLHLAYLKEAI